ncbi:hypothetical protein A7E78_03595 [Syntrophotalea acetylenivorans]|uniref:TolC family protein n=1 Tax=Syntrophotalea acetylenivorans TaxID=1842532 RepID=A0A1L3GM76_9BACT|nr:TolC family protein [Syntrophotalea acetylenivorans]APG26995.1 hypothetical protein A7E78_03595 [Syntrophotalea acetylenivorans]
MIKAPDSLAGLLFVLLLLIGVPEQIEAVAGESTDPGSNPRARLARHVDEALNNNPDLQAAEARWQMARHKIGPARSFEDPQLSFVLSNYPVDSLGGDETPMTGKEIQLSQMFPFPGKLAAQGEMAEYQAIGQQGVYEEAKRQLVQKVKDAWFLLYFQQRAIDITRLNLDILRDFIQLTETRYAVGTGLQQDVLKAQVERSRLLDRLFNLEQQRISSLAEFNRLLNRPSSTPLAPPEVLKPTMVQASQQQLLGHALTQRPLFTTYQAGIDRYKTQRRLAKLDYYPNFKIFAGYRQREEVPGDPVEGDDFVSAGVSINLPLWQGKRKAAVAEADSGIRLAQRQYQELSNRVAFAITDQYAQMTKNRDLVDLYQTGIIPQAEQSFEASLAAYQVGDVDFLNLLDSLMTLFRYQVDYHRALADHERSVARLEATVGIDLSSGEEVK